MHLQLGIRYWQYGFTSSRGKIITALLFVTISIMSQIALLLNDSFDWIDALQENDLWLKTPVDLQAFVSSNGYGSLLLLAGLSAMGAGLIFFYVVIFKARRGICERRCPYCGQQFDPLRPAPHKCIECGRAVPDWFLGVLKLVAVPNNNADWWLSLIITGLLQIHIIDQ